MKRHVLLLAGLEMDALELAERPDGHRDRSGPRLADVDLRDLVAGAAPVFLRSKLTSTPAPSVPGLM